MIIDREMSLGKVLWFLGGVAAGYLLKEIVEEYMVERELAATSLADERMTGEEEQKNP